MGSRINQQFPRYLEAGIINLEKIQELEALPVEIKKQCIELACRYGNERFVLPIIKDKEGSELAELCSDDIKKYFKVFLKFEFF